MERIIIIGCPGSGKSALARQLGRKLGLPVIHLDQLWQKQTMTVGEFDAQLDMALAMDRWIIDGNYGRTMEARLQKCDTVLYLDFSRRACLWGFARRVLANRGEGFDRNLVRYIWSYNRQNRVRNATHLAKAKHAKAIVLKNRREVKAFLQAL